MSRWRAGKLHLSTRIALAILGGIIVVQLLNITLFLVLPRPELRIFNLRRMVEQAHAACSQLAALPLHDRARVAAEHEAPLSIMWRAQQDTSFPPASPLTARLQASLARALEDVAKRVEVVRLEPPLSALSRSSITFIPGEADPLWSRAISTPDLDIPLPEFFEIAIQLHDNSWVVIRAQSSGPSVAIVLGLLGAIAAAIVIAGVLSVFTARRTIQPLDRLIAATEHLGLVRQPLPISAEGLREFAPIAHALNDMQRRLAQFISDRTHLLAAISHDLRTPLTSLRLDAERIPDSALRLQLTNDIDDLSAMVEATLKFTGEEMTPETRRPVDLATLLISVCDDFQDRGKDVAYEGPEHLGVICQPIAMKRAIVNVIDNAIKYGSCAAVTLEQAPKLALINIRDNGPGIPELSFEAAFSPFRRLDPARSRAIAGVGLGLTIARDIVRAHAGDVILANQPGGGLAVTIQIPLAAR